MSWTPERIDQLKALWAAGRSCSQIARDLGAPAVTRNSVIGTTQPGATTATTGTTANPLQPQTNQRRGPGGPF